MPQTTVLLVDRTFARLHHKPDDLTKTRYEKHHASLKDEFAAQDYKIDWLYLELDDKDTTRIQKAFQSTDIDYVLVAHTFLEDAKALAAFEHVLNGFHRYGNKQMRLCFDAGPGTELKTLKRWDD